MLGALPSVLPHENHLRAEHDAPTFWQCFRKRATTGADALQGSQRIRAAKRLHVRIAAPEFIECSHKGRIKIVGCDVAVSRAKGRIDGP